MTIRQAKKIFKASFTYCRYLSIKGPRFFVRYPLVLRLFNAPYWDIKAYKERSNPRFRKALRVTRKFSRPIYEVAWGGAWPFF